MATSALRPLSVGEILDAGVKVVTRHWKPLIGSLLAIYAPIWLLSTLISASFDTSGFDFGSDPFGSSGDDPSGQDIVVSLAASVLILVASLVAYVAVFKGVCDAWLGNSPSIGRSLRFGLQRAPRALLLGFIWFWPIVLFTIMCGVPGLWLGTVWSLSIPALLFESLGPFKALGRSFNLISGRFWESLVIVIVALLVYFVIAFVIGLVFGGIAVGVDDQNDVVTSIAASVGNLIAESITVPYCTALLTILYFDQRVRKEGLDVQLLAGDWDPDAPLPVPPSVPAGYAPPPMYPPPPGWQSPSGWQGPQASPDSPLRWGPAAETPPTSAGQWQAPGAGGWGPPAGAAPPWADEVAGAQPPAGDAPPPWQQPADVAPARDAPPWSRPDATPPAADAPPWSRPDAAPPADDAPPAADSPAAGDSPAPDSPWMSPPGDSAAPPSVQPGSPLAEDDRWKPSGSGWKPSGEGWKPGGKKDDEDEDER